MNKELIKKYKKEFDHWLNGGTLLCTNDLKEWSYIVNPTFQDDNLIYIINDEYVEFRKALCEGKTVQHISATTGEWVDFNKGFEPTPRYTFLTAPEYYRIKPEESKFKVGDWVRAPSGCIYQINETNVLHGTEHFIPWQPKEGEWCWFYSKEIKQEHIGTHWAIPSLGQFKSKTETGVETIEGFLYLYCEPFIGELPSLLKDSNDSSNN